MKPLKSWQKYLLLLVTIWPIFYIIFFMSVVIGMILSATGGGVPENLMQENLPSFLLILFPLHFLTILLSLVVLVFYVFNAAKREKFSDNDRLIWILMIIFANFIGELAYFFIHIWPEQRSDSDRFN